MKLFSSHNTLFSKAIALLGAALLIVGAHSSAMGQIIYETDFNGLTGDFPGVAAAYAHWSTGGSSSPTYILNGSGVLQMTNPTDAASSSQYASAYWTGSEGGVVDGAVADGKISTIVQYVANTNQSMGVMARVQSPFNASKPEGYFAGILRYNRGSGNETFLVIAKNIQNADVKSYVISPLVNISVSSGNYYRLSLEFVGNELTAMLWSNSTGGLIGTVTVTDDSYASGVTGLRTNFAETNRIVGYENFQLEAIPEASVATLLPIGVVALAGFRLVKRGGLRKGTQ